MSSEEERLKHYRRINRNLAAKALRLQKFQPKVVKPKRPEPLDIRMSDIRKGIDFEE